MEKKGKTRNRKDYVGHRGERGEKEGGDRKRMDGDKKEMRCCDYLKLENTMFIPLGYKLPKRNMR